MHIKPKKALNKSTERGLCHIETAEEERKSKQISEAKEQLRKFFAETEFVVCLSATTKASILYVTRYRL